MSTMWEDPYSYRNIKHGYSNETGLGNEKVISEKQYDATQGKPREAVKLKSLLTTKKLLIMGTWNVRTLYEAGGAM